MLKKTFVCDYGFCVLLALKNVAIKLLLGTTCISVFPASLTCSFYLKSPMEWKCYFYYYSSK